MNTNCSLPSGTIIGNYKIQETLGQGGGGISYLAFDHALERAVVIKEHYPMGLCHRAGNGAEVTPTDETLYTQSLATFCKEARLLAQLSHPNIVRVYDIFEGTGTAYLVMEYINGVNLRDFMQQATTDFPTVSNTLTQLLHTLHYLHGNSVLHRDIKPGNIIIRNNGAPVIIDFGSAHTGTANHTLTPVGSPGYAAPEQFSPHGKVGAWSDLFALAQCFLHLLTAQQKKKAPHQFIKTLHKAAAPAIENRFKTADEWLQNLPSGHVKHTVSLIIFAGIAIIAAILGLLIFIIRPAESSPAQQTPLQQQPDAQPTTPQPPPEQAQQTVTPVTSPRATPSAIPFCTPLRPLVPKESGMQLTKDGIITTKE